MLDASKDGLTGDNGALKGRPLWYLQVLLMITSRAYISQSENLDRRQTFRPGFIWYIKFSLYLVNLAMLGVKLSVPWASQLFEPISPLAELLFEFQPFSLFRWDFKMRPLGGENNCVSWECAVGSRPQEYILTLWNITLVKRFLNFFHISEGVSFKDNHNLIKHCLFYDNTSAYLNVNDDATNYLKCEKSTQVMDT